ncbi:MAG: aspartyl protease family protein [Candidatus Baltobacteraceae bacterium]
MKNGICCAIAAALIATAALSTARADDGTSAPDGIAPTTMTLTRLLALHRAATGKLAPGTAHTRAETRTYVDGVLTGSQTEYAVNGDSRQDTILGVFHSASGKHGTTAWEQNRNGLVRTMTGLHSRDDVNTAALENASNSSPYVKLLGVVKDPGAAYVVKVDPPRGRIEYLYYDAATYLVSRDDNASEGKRVSFTYDDYRLTQGVRRPWHIHQTNGIKGDDTDWKVQSLEWGGRVDPAKVAIPPNVPTVAFSGARAALPVTFSGDRIILTMRIGAHKVSLQMDSGASGILLNRAVADATGVKSYGSWTRETAGEYLTAEALIPEVDFGGVTMQNVAAETAPYADETYDGAPVAGLMGYDFIAGAVMHVDYYNSTVEAIAPGSFTPPAAAMKIPLRLDDGVPVIDARIGSAAAHHFIVDTGADRSMIFSGFAQAHTADVADQGLGESMTASYPFISQIYGVGGKVQVRPVQVPSLSIGSITFPKWLFDVSKDAPSFEGDDYDGLIGQDVLRNFDVYFDYANAVMYLVPNERYRQRWG